MDQEDKEKFGVYHARFISGGYVALQINSKTILLHRAIMGETEELIDHKNGNVLDNRKENLRKATKSQNAINSGLIASNTSGYRGVTFNGKHWRARITANGKTYHIGNYSTKEQASEAYKRKAKQLFGEFHKS